jgi:hypothetical protein
MWLPHSINNKNCQRKSLSSDRLSVSLLLRPKLFSHSNFKRRRASVFHFEEQSSTRIRTWREELPFLFLILIPNTSSYLKNKTLPEFHSILRETIESDESIDTFMYICLINQNDWHCFQNMMMTRAKWKSFFFLSLSSTWERKQMSKETKGRTIEKEYSKNHRLRLSCSCSREIHMKWFQEQEWDSHQKFQFTLFLFKYFAATIIFLFFLVLLVSSP